MEGHARLGQNDISFVCEGETMHGHLFLPATFDNTQRLPGIVVAPCVGYQHHPLPLWPVACNYAASRYS